jgi:hypothetical protein
LHFRFLTNNQNTVSLTCNFRWPIIHLEIDINGIFWTPGRIKLVIPNALEVRGESTDARGRNKQIATKLKIESDEARIKDASRKRLQTEICG